MVAIVEEKNASYVQADEYYRPSALYPEYMFGEISERKNHIYDMVREAFHLMELDMEHYGTEMWNPLSKYVHCGDRVVIKPNLVFHRNKSGWGMDCLVTDASVVAPVIDYVLIALKDKGHIIVGDAPLQECMFEEMIEKTGYGKLVEYYRGKTNVTIELCDFRNVRNYKDNGIEMPQKNGKADGGVTVSLGEYSQFSSLDEKKIERLRVTNYDPREMQHYHSIKEHNYCINKELLAADVIINVCKPKTHRKAGITAALKNFVGTVAEKACLPHHTAGSAADKGDAYLNKNDILDISEELLDIANKLTGEGEYKLAQQAQGISDELRRKGKKTERYYEGSWYGNDTIWRTIIDLNRILKYADKAGHLQKTIQRNIFAIGDMVVSGEKEGPLCPSPTYPGIIVMGDDLYEFDKTVCSLMGFDYEKIPLLKHSEAYYGALPISENAETRICSTNEEWNRQSLYDIMEHHSLEFQPTDGWEDMLGNRYKRKLLERLKDKKVYIFGAGKNGIRTFQWLTENQVEVIAFVDSNKEKWQCRIIDKIECISPDKMDKDVPIVLSVGEKSVKEIKNELGNAGYNVVGIVNFDI